MKQPEYVEGPEALANFKQFATAILQALSTKKKQAKKPASRKSPKKSDKGGKPGTSMISKSQEETEISFRLEE